MSSAYPVKKNIKAVFSYMFSWQVIPWYTYTFYQKTFVGGKNLRILTTLISPIIGVFGAFMFLRCIVNL